MRGWWILLLCQHEFLVANTSQCLLAIVTTHLVSTELRVGKINTKPWFFSHPILVGGAITILKNMNSSMERINPYMKWKIRFMFQTTTEYIIQ